MFAQLEHNITAHPRVLGSTDVAGLLALAGRDVVDSGQSEYFAYASAARPLPWLVPAEQVGAKWDAFAGSLATDISSGHYDLIIRNQRWGLIPEDLVAMHYHRTSTVDIEFAWSGQRWPVDVWEPARGQ